MREKKWKKFLIRYGMLIDIFFLIIVFAVTSLLTILFLSSEVYCFAGLPRSFLCLVLRLSVLIVLFSPVTSFCIWVHLKERLFKKLREITDELRKRDIDLLHVRLQLNKVDREYELKLAKSLEKLHSKETLNIADSLKKLREKDDKEGS